MSQVETIQAFKTTDGNVFVDERAANLHQAELVYEEELREIIHRAPDLMSDDEQTVFLFLKNPISRNNVENVIARFRKAAEGR